MKNLFTKDKKDIDAAHLLGSVTIIPLFEEILFRGEMLSNQARSMTKVSAVFNNTLIFTASHCFDYFHKDFIRKTTGLSCVALSGINFSTLYLLTNDLWASTASHLTNNALIVSRYYFFNK